MSTLRLRCRCDALLSIHSDSIGKKAKCGSCDTTFVVPDPKIRKLESTQSKDRAKAATTAACPSCDKELGANMIVCIHCGYHTRLKRRLVTEQPDKTDLSSGAVLIANLTLSVAVLIACGFILDRFDGPQFLVFYFSLFCVYGILTPLLRRIVQDSDAFNYAAMFTLLGLGVMRYIQSTMAGGSKFGFLLCGMIATTFLYAISLTQIEASKDNDPPLADANGRLSVWKFYGVFFGLVALSIPPLFFPEARQAVGEVIGTLAVVSGIALGLIWLHFFAASDGSGSGWMAGCSSCGGGCGSGCGGCGGGCGGCGS